MYELAQRPSALVIKENVIFESDYPGTRDLVTKNLNGYLVEALDRERELRPLLLFKGNVTEHRARAMFSLLRFLRDNNISKPNRASLFMAQLPDERHLSGLHCKTVDGMSWVRWLSRLRQCPKVFSIDKNLRDYVEYLWSRSEGFAKYILLDPISATAYRSKRAWRQLERTIGSVTEHYPFITKDRTIESSVLLAVHQAVPRTLPEDIRADVCQDLIVAILSGEASVNNVSDFIPRHLKSHRHMYGDRWRTISLETPIDRDGDSRTLADMLKD